MGPHQGDVGGKDEPNLSSTGSSKYTWNEIRTHNTRHDKWIVIEGEVYNVSKWAYKHPGGSIVMTHYAGQDATEAFMSFHTDLVLVRKYMKAVHIGSVHEDDREVTPIEADFKQLTQTAHKMDLFKPSACFYIFMVGQIVGFEILAYLIMSYYGTGWIPYLAAVACYTITQGQASWTQHDFGHLSVFKSNWWNHQVHYFLMNHIKGASGHWWRHLHNQHHAKPNVLDKDPDTRLNPLFVVGEEMPKKIAKENREQPPKWQVPYNLQEKYFWAIGPPLLFPLIFQIQVFRHSITRRAWVDFAWLCSFYIKIFALYSPMLGFFGAAKFYFFVRCLESQWFVWVAQSNHVPMEIQSDQERKWLSLQIHATCNIERGVFNDWFTGHLNQQIEHHLWPTMPRHNLHKMAPMVKSLCEKHGLNYVTKPLLKSFADIPRSLKNAGDLWALHYEAYGLNH